MNPPPLHKHPTSHPFTANMPHPHALSTRSHTPPQSHSYTCHQPPHLALHHRLRNRLLSPRSWHFDIDGYLDPIVPASPLHKLPTAFSWWLGYRDRPHEDVGNVLAAFWAALGAFAGLGVVAGVFWGVEGVRERYGERGGVLVASFGASAILEYNSLRSPLGQPRNAILGHTFSALVGVAITKLFALNSAFAYLTSSSTPMPESTPYTTWIPGALSCALSSVLMLLTNTVHPPGGASAVLAASDPVVREMGWWFVLLVLLGSTLMVVVGCIVNNIMRRFPVYWWVEHDVREARRIRSVCRNQRHLHARKKIDGALECAGSQGEEETGDMAGTVDIEGTAGADLPEEMSVRGLCEGLEDELSRVQMLELGVRVLRDLGLEGDEGRFLDGVEVRLREKLEREEIDKGSVSSGEEKSNTSL